MVDIYDELGHIKDVLEHGISNMWQMDVSLLAKFYAENGLRQSEAKKILLEKCRKVPNYDHIKNYKKLNNIIKKSYQEIKKGKKIRNITEIVISKEVLDWFLDLENKFVISDELKNEINKTRKEKITNNPINFNRTKFLFTLYIWTKVQEHYVNVPNMHYLKKNGSRFKKNAHLPKTFSVNKEKNILYDLGLIYINSQQGIDAVFIKNYGEIFQIPITDKNKIVIKGEDMYDCGIWLEKQKFGSYKCQKCGKEFPFKGKGKGEKSRKYCDDCFKELYGKKENNTRICVDCGNEFDVSPLDTKSIRCSNCQEEHLRKEKREYMRKKRENEKKT